MTRGFAGRPLKLSPSCVAVARGCHVFSTTPFFLKKKKIKQKKKKEMEKKRKMK